MLTVETGVKLLKCVEGQFNKAFLVTFLLIMDNGYEILARLPNLTTGPLFFTTASEVATGHFGDSIVGYAEAIGNNKIQWAISYGRPRTNYHRSMECLETPDNYVALLNSYMALALFLAPTSTSEQLNRISHPDLHLDNIFVDPETYHNTSIIDWQQTAVSRVFLQRSYPQMLEFSASPYPDQKTQEKMLLEHYYDATNTNDSIKRQQTYQRSTSQAKDRPLDAGNRNIYSLFATL
ncbi:hypothetical protein N7453_004617 [Penicillium expansum]|nr:hypothetical protein N7453_004617 [Penicillium expansum]